MRNTKRGPAVDDGRLKSKLLERTQRTFKRIVSSSTAVLAIFTLTVAANAQSTLGSSHAKKSACDNASVEPGTIIGSLASIPHASGPVVLELMPASSAADAHVRSIAVAYALRGDDSAPKPAAVTTVEDLQRSLADAQAMPTVISQTKFIFLQSAGDFHCAGMLPGRYHAIARIPVVAATTGMYRSAGKTLTVTDYYTTDVVIPPVPRDRRVVVQAAGFRRIGRSPAGF